MKCKLDETWWHQPIFNMVYNIIVKTDAKAIEHIHIDDVLYARYTCV